MYGSGRRSVVVTGCGGDGVLGGTDDVKTDETLTVDGNLVTGGSLNVTGGAGDDAIRGGAKADVLNGGAGDDILLGGAGDDTNNGGDGDDVIFRSEEHTSELQSLMRISYAVFCLKKKKHKIKNNEQ